MLCLFSGSWWIFFSSMFKRIREWMRGPMGTAKLLVGTQTCHWSVFVPVAEVHVFLDTAWKSAVGLGVKSILRQSPNFIFVAEVLYQTYCCWDWTERYFLDKFLIFFFFFFLLYNIVFVLPYINMNPPRVYTCSPSWTPLLNLYWKESKRILLGCLFFGYESCMDVRVGLWRKLNAEELMLFNCGVGEDSWVALGLQGDPTSPF